MDSNRLGNKSWSKVYELGVYKIDQQFEKLFVIFDELNELNGVNDPYANNQLKKVLMRLEDYSEQFASIDNSLIKTEDFGEVDLYVNNYQKLLTRVDDFIVQYSSNNPLLIEGMIDFLKKWLLTQLLQARKVFVG